MTNNNAILVDFDHTLATYTSGLFPAVGKPVEKMVNLIKNYKEQGYEIRIFTARVNDIAKFSSESYDCHLPEEVEKLDREQREIITDWCKEYLGFIPVLTNSKTYDALCIIDDRSFNVLPNTGIIVGTSDPVEFLKIPFEKRGGVYE